MERRLHAHTPGTRTPRHPRNWGRILENHFHVSTIYPLPSIHVNRGTHHKGLPISTCHTLVLSPIWNKMRQAYAQAHTSKPWRQTKPRAENKKFRRIRRCQTNQSRKNHPSPPNKGAYRYIPSQVAPNPTLTHPERSTPSYQQIHWPKRHPTKLSLTKARKVMMRSEHHHAV
jgi:hypothetical protein